MRIAAGLDQHHAVLAQRDQHRVDAAIVDQHARRGDDRRFIVDRAIGGGAELAAVRLDQRGAAICPIVGALGVDHDGVPGAARRGDDLGGDALGQHALGVVRDDDDLVLRQELAHHAEEIVAQRAGERRGLLAVGAQHLLGPGDVAGLERRGAAAFGQEMRLGAAEPAP